MHQTYTLLSLGDSYTIGESVSLQKSFPCQTVQLLRKQGYYFLPPEIVAQTGWTTDELDDAIKQHTFLSKYDFITLLIGVNNQFRGRSAEEYKLGFENLLKEAIHFANDKKEHVVVLSIPDYSNTPFAKNKDVEKISKEIEVFNTIAKAVSIQYKVTYLDITPEFNEVKNDPSLLASDQLHPSAKEYAKWAKKLSDILIAKLK